MFFLSGVARYLFLPLAEAVVFAMLASYILSRTLVPTLLMWFYQHLQYHGHGADPSAVKPWVRPFVLLGGGFEHGFHRLRERYGDLLRVLLTHRLAFGAAFLSFCAASFLLVPWLGQDFFPAVDAGAMRLHVRASTGTRIEETALLIDRVESAIRREIPQKTSRV